MIPANEHVLIRCTLSMIDCALVWLDRVVLMTPTSKARETLTGGLILIRHGIVQVNAAMTEKE